MNLRTSVAKLMLVLLAPHLAGCTTTSHVAVSSPVTPRHIIAVTTKAGRTIKFVTPGATIAGDTLYAVDSTGQIRIPTDSIASITVKEPSEGKTILLTVGIILVALALLAGFVIESGPRAAY